MKNDALKASLLGYRRVAQENAEQESSLGAYDSYAMGEADGQIEIIDIVLRFIDKE